MSETNGTPETFEIEPEPLLRFEIGEEVIEDYAYSLLELTDHATKQATADDGSIDLTRWDILAGILAREYSLETTPSRYIAKQIHQVVNTKVAECEDNLKKKLDGLLG